MNTPKLLVIMRHAESMRNVAKKGSTYFADDEARREVKGIPDNLIPITPAGLEHAARTGKLLHIRFGSFDYVYHSGYRRTEQTLEAVLTAFPPLLRSRMKVRQNTFIRERDPGYTYDMTEQEVDVAFPWLREYWQTHGGFLSRPPGGESLADVVNRVYTFLHKLYRDRAGMNVLVITHGGTIRCFRYLIEGWTYEQAEKWPPGQSPKNCGLTVYTPDEDLDRMKLREYNLTC